MKQTHTFIVHFWLKKNSIKKNGTTPIYLRIRLDGKSADISTKESIFPEHWGRRAERVNPKAKNANHVNSALDDISSEIKNTYRVLLQEGRFITVQAIKLRFLGEDTPLKSLKDLLKYHREKEIQKLATGTAKNYGSTEKYLLSFISEKHRTTDIPLTHINYAFVLDFENYLRNCKPLMKSQPLNNNGIMKHLERFKKMTTIACKLDCVKQDPFAFFNSKFTSFDRQYLTIEELILIEELHLTDIGLRRVRDCFVFACYTGLSYVDVKWLGPEQIVIGIDGDEWIFTKREKSKTSVKIPLLTKAKEVLVKYSGEGYGKNRDLLLPVYANQKCNAYLKKIVAKCKIDKNISFHAARHTFATTVTLANGVPIETVSKLLGHRRLSTTQIYARVMETKISEDIAVLRTKLKSSQLTSISSVNRSV
jgi:integrase/recombinase XerD